MMIKEIRFVMLHLHYASISGFPLGPTPGDPGEFVQMPIQTSSKPPGYRAEEFSQIPCPLGATIRTSVPVNAQMYEFSAQKPAICFAYRPSFKVCCISVQLAPLDQIVVLYIYFLLSFKVLRAVM